MKNWMIDTIINELENLEDTTIGTQSAGYDIFERANVDGTFTFNRESAWDWVNKHHRDLRFFIPEHSEFITANPITDPEAFQVQVMMEYTSDIMVQIFRNINMDEYDVIELNRENLARIEIELGNLK